MQSVADVFRQTEHLLLLQPAAHELHAHVRAVVDFGVVCWEIHISCLSCPFALSTHI